MYSCFKCSKCDAEFPEKWRLERHKARSCPGIKPPKDGSGDNRKRKDGRANGRWAGKTWRQSNPVAEERPSSYTRYFPPGPMNRRLTDGRRIETPEDIDIGFSDEEEDESEDENDGHGWLIQDAVNAESETEYQQLCGGNGDVGSGWLETMATGIGLGLGDEGDNLGQAQQLLDGELDTPEGSARASPGSAGTGGSGSGGSGYGSGGTGGSGSSAAAAAALRRGTSGRRAAANARSVTATATADRTATATTADNGRGARKPRPNEQRGRTASATASASKGIADYSTETEQDFNVLRLWFDAHKVHPFPSDDEKLQMERAANLSPYRVSEWFRKNR